MKLEHHTLTTSKQEAADDTHDNNKNTTTEINNTALSASSTSSSPSSSLSTVMWSSMNADCLSLCFSFLNVIDEHDAVHEVSRHFHTVALLHTSQSPATLLLRVGSAFMYVTERGDERSIDKRKLTQLRSHVGRLLVIGDSDTFQYNTHRIAQFTALSTLSLDGGVRLSPSAFTFIFRLQLRTLIARKFTFEQYDFDADVLVNVDAYDAVKQCMTSSSIVNIVLHHERTSAVSSHAYKQFQHGVYMKLIAFIMAMPQLHSFTCAHAFTHEDEQQLHDLLQTRASATLTCTIRNQLSTPHTTTVISPAP